MTTLSRVRRKRGPAVVWAPVQDSHYALAQMLRSEARTPLSLTQAAICEVESHLRESSSPMPFGLLAGDLCLCPQTKLEYVLVDTVAHARIELADYDPYAQLAGELRSLTAEQARRRKVAIGWYLGGMADDLTLDSEVASLHRELFPERWQVVLVRGEAAGTERGALLRFESMWSNWYSIPFNEVLSEHAWGKKGERRTAIRWANYQTDGPALPLDEREASARRSKAPRSWWSSSGFRALLEPLRRVGDWPAARASDRTQPASARVSQELAGTPKLEAVGALLLLSLLALYLIAS